jgi:hypothetical protein
MSNLEGKPNIVVTDIPILRDYIVKLYQLHKKIAREEFFPCGDVIKIFIDQANSEEKTK